MSLEDKFYPEDGTVLTNIDNFLIKSAGKVGGVYQHLTGNSYKELVKKSYKVSTAGFGISLAGLRASALLFGFLSYKKSVLPRFESPLQEEIREEILGVSKYLGGKSLRLTTSLFIPIMLSAGISSLSKEDISHMVKYFVASSLVESISLVPYMFAEYLSKAEVPEPPKKTVFEKAKESLSEVFKPLPLPVPVRATYNRQI